jgi:hypothetical protein
MKSLKQIVDKHFKLIFHTATHYLCKNHPNKWKYHHLLTHLPLEQSYLGKLMCGEMHYISKYVLELYGYNVEVFQNQQGYSDYFTDHCFLYVDGHIIDLTYRQILETEMILDIDSSFLNKIHKQLPPYFIGTPQYLESFLDNTLNEDSEQILYCLKRFQMDNNHTQRFEMKDKHIISIINDSLNIQ